MVLLYRFLLDTDNSSSSCLGNFNSPQHLLDIVEQKKLFSPVYLHVKNTWKFSHLSKVH